MKRILTLLMITFSAVAVFAQTDQFPQVTAAKTSILLNIGQPGLRIYAPDGGRLLCDSMMYYEIDGAVRPASADWSIRTTGGTMNAAETNSPTAVLARLLKAYQSLNLTSVAACYDSVSAASLNAMLKTDSIKIKFIMAMANLNYMDLQVMFNYNDYTYLFVKMFYHDGSSALMLFMAKLIQNEWRLVAAEDSYGLSFNLLSYLATHSAYTILSSEDIDGDGVLNDADNCPCSKLNDCE